MNTHLHHAEFDRDAGNGFKFNYIHCNCTNEEKNFLKTKLKAEFEDSKGVYNITLQLHTKLWDCWWILYTDNEQEGTEHSAVPVTAIIKVKDCPGALWNALWQIGVSFIVHVLSIDPIFFTT